MTSVFRETGHLKKMYHDPVASFLNFSAGTLGKSLKRTMADVTWPSTIKIDFAECIRLGELFDVDDPGLPYKFYIPCSGDVVQRNNSLFVVEDMAAADYYAPVERHVTWQGPVVLLRGDSADPLRPVKRQPENPPLETPSWVK